MINLLAEEAETTVEFCSKSAEIWQVVGYAFFIFKIVIPLILIIVGAMDLGKAVVADDADQIKKSTTKFAKRVIAGLVIFFIPTLIGVVMSLVNGFDDSVEADYKICKTCITSPGSCDVPSDE